MAAWPWDLCKIRLADYQLGRESDVDRSVFDSGEISQLKKFTRGFQTREFEVMVKVRNVVAFRKWLDGNAHTWFDFRDWEDKTIRRVRVRGGAGAVALRVKDGERLDGERYLTSRVTLEGYS